MSTSEKPGVKTTEFWITAVTSVIGLLVAIGLISFADSEMLADSIAKIGGAVGIFIAEAIKIWKYIDSRIQAKKIAADAEVAAVEAQVNSDAIRVEDRRVSLDREIHEDKAARRPVLPDLDLKHGGQNDH